jgi:hypothetical protein
MEISYKPHVIQADEQSFDWELTKSPLVQFFMPLSVLAQISPMPPQF